MVVKMKKKKIPRYQDRRRYVVLRMVGKNLDPDKITNLLKLYPSSAQPSANIKRKFKKIYNTRYGHWTLDSRLKRNSTLQNQVKDIYQQIKPKRKILKKILKNIKADLNISVQPHEKLVYVAYMFPAKIINEFTSLGIDIRFSVYI